MAVFVESFAPPPRMLVFGAVDFTAALVRVAKVLGYRVTVCDAREVFATRARFPLADEVVVDWPDRLLERVGGDAHPARRGVRAHPRRQVRRARHRGGARPPTSATSGRWAAGARTPSGSSGCARRGSTTPAWPASGRRSASTSAPARPRRRRCRSAPRSSPSAPGAADARPLARHRRADPPAGRRRGDDRRRRAGRRGRVALHRLRAARATSCWRRTAAAPVVEWAIEAADGRGARRHLRGAGRHRPAACRRWPADGHVRAQRPVGRGHGHVAAGRRRPGPARTVTTPWSSGLGDQPLVPAEAWRRVAGADRLADRGRHLRGRAGQPGAAVVEAWPLLPAAGRRGRAARDAPSARSGGGGTVSRAGRRHRHGGGPRHRTDPGGSHGADQRVPGRRAGRAGVGRAHRRRAHRPVHAGRPAPGGRGRRVPGRRQGQGRPDHRPVQGRGHVRRADEAAAQGGAAGRGPRDPGPGQRQRHDHRHARRRRRRHRGRRSSPT